MVHIDQPTQTESGDPEMGIRGAVDAISYDELPLIDVTEPLHDMDGGSFEGGSTAYAELFSKAREASQSEGQLREAAQVVLNGVTITRFEQKREALIGDITDSLFGELAEASDHNDQRTVKEIDGEDPDIAKVRRQDEFWAEVAVGIVPKVLETTHTIVRDGLEQSVGRHRRATRRTNAAQRLAYGLAESTDHLVRDTDEDGEQRFFDAVHGRIERPDAVTVFDKTYESITDPSTSIGRGIRSVQEARQRGQTVRQSLRNLRNNTLLESTEGDTIDAAQHYQNGSVGRLVHAFLEDIRASRLGNEEQLAFYDDNNPVRSLVERALDYAERAAVEALFEIDVIDRNDRQIQHDRRRNPAD